jgi:hypothetical protein
MSKITDDAIITEDAVARARAAMSGQRYQSSPAAVAALERRQLLRNAAATGARATHDRNWDPSPSTTANAPASEVSAADVCHQLAAVMLSNAKAKRVHHGARADAEEPKPAPSYECAKCSNAIAPDDEIYCGACAGIDGEDGKPVDTARDCSGCGDPVGPRAYCSTCAGKGEQPVAAAAHVNRSTNRTSIAAEDVQCPACNAAPRVTCKRTVGMPTALKHHNGRSTLAYARNIVGMIACSSCNVDAGQPCRDHGRGGALIGDGACRDRRRSMDAAAALPPRNVDDSSYASISVG